MLLYSDYFGLKRSAFLDAGVFNGVVGEDVGVHVNPLMLQNCEEPEFKGAYAEFLSYFTSIIALSKKVISDPNPNRYFNQLMARFNFKEIPNTGLGYTRKGRRGNGISGSLSRQLAQTAVEVVRDGIEDPIFFTLMPLFQEGIGADRFSDMTISILKERFYNYSLRKAEELGLPTALFPVENGIKRVKLPYCDKKSIILVPDSILSSLPITSDPSDIGNASGYNSSLRKAISEAIGVTLSDFEKMTKQAKKEELCADKEKLAELLSLIAVARFLPYDFSRDSRWVYLPIYVKENYPELFPLISLQFTEQNLMDIVLLLCKRFKELIENNRMSKLLYGEDGRHCHESFVQRLFFCVVDIYCDLNNIDVNRESDPGCGELDFKFSQGSRKKVIVEIKLSSSSQLEHGFTRQLPIYMDTEKTQNGIFMVLRMSEKDDKKIESVKAEHDAISEGRLKPELIIIDAVPHESASKI